MFANQSLSFAATSTVEFKPRWPSSSSKISMQAFAETARIDARKTNLYDVLNVNENASVKEIKAAYRSMAKRFHPDAAAAGGLDSGDFIEICNAYAVLSDPTAKARYDLEMRRGAAVRYPVLSFSGGGAGGYKTRRTWETDQCW